MALCTPTVRLSSLVTWWLMRIVFPSLLPALAMLCVASMGKMGRKELCSQPGRVAAELQHPNVTPVSCEFPLFLAKTSARTHHVEEEKPSLPFTCTPGVWGQSSEFAVSSPRSQGQSVSSCGLLAFLDMATEIHCYLLLVPCFLITGISEHIQGAFYWEWFGSFAGFHLHWSGEGCPAAAACLQFSYCKA